MFLASTTPPPSMPLNLSTPHPYVQEGTFTYENNFQSWLKNQTSNNDLGVNFILQELKDVYNIDIEDYGTVKYFLKQNSEIIEYIQEVPLQIKKYFGTARLKLVVDPDNENSEKDGAVLFFVVLSNESAEEAINKLAGFDSWFIPNIYKKNSYLNVALDFEQ